MDHTLVAAVVDELLEPFGQKANQHNYTQIAECWLA